MTTLRLLTAWWRVDLLALGLVSLAGFLTSFSRGSEGSAIEPTAKTLMKQAHEGRAVWTEFTGFTARVRCRVDGASVDGQVIVGPDGKVTLFDLPSRHLAITNKSDGSRISQQIEFLDYQFSATAAAK